MSIIERSNIQCPFLGGSTIGCSTVYMYITKLKLCMIKQNLTAVRNCPFLSHTVEPLNTFGAGTLSFDRRLFLLQRWTSKSHPSILRLNLLRGVACERLNQ